MKRIEVKRAEDDVIRVYAVNSDGSGLFSRGEREGVYHQTLGTGQFHAASEADLVAQLLRSGAIDPNDMVVESYGWDLGSGT